MKEDWIASAIEELDSGKLTPEARADLEIAVAREMSGRMAAEQWTEYVQQRARKERNAEIARQMKLQGEPIEKIALYTGLTTKEIEKL